MAVGVLLPGWRAGKSGINRFLVVPPPPAPAPTVSSISTNTGSTAGGEARIITGFNFVNGATVTIGGNAATGVSFVGTTQLNIVTPAHAAAGPSGIDVVVTNPDTQIGTLANAFTYAAPGGVTPNILNRALFTTDFAGFLAIANYAFPPTNVTRDTTGTPAGGSGPVAVKAHLPTGGEVSTQFYYHFYDNVFPGPPRTDQHANRVRSRFEFYLQGAFDGILKLQLFYTNADNDYGGWYLSEGALGWEFAESLFNGGTTLQLISLAGNSPDGRSMLNNWHSLEVDYWRDGNTENGGNDYPSVLLKLDDIILAPGNILSITPNGGKVWIGNRLNAGRRTYSGGIGQTNLVGNKNGGNLVAADIWVNNVSLSSAGDIGP